MENPLLSSDLSTLKELLQEPILYIKEEFTTKTTSVSPESSNPQSPIIQTIGQNNKGITFLVFTNTKELNSIDKDLYTKTLSALKLNSDDIAFGIADLSFANNFDEISSSRKNQRIVCFANSDLYPSDTILTSFSYNDSNIFTCPSLNELSSNQELKIRWWNGLKAFLS